MNNDDDVCMPVAMDGDQQDNCSDELGIEGMTTVHELDGGQIRVFLVEDHLLFRTQLARLINKDQRITVCGESDNAQDALRMIEETKPDIAIVDIWLKGTNGLELIKELKARNSKVLVLVLTMHEESMYAERALRAGASGYVTKHQSAEHLREAIEQVFRGEIYLSGQITARLLQMLSTPEQEGKVITPLSPREAEVFQLLGQGLSNREIAEQLQMGEKTVHSHRFRIKEKLGIRHTAELYNQAARRLEDQGSP